MVGARICKLWMISALFCASLAMPAYGQVTGKDAGASSFATSNGPGALGDPAQVVPGASSGSDGFTSHYANPDGLQTAGQGAMAGNEMFGLMANGAANRASYSLSANDDWLKKSLGLVADPSDGSGVIGEASQSCQDKTVTRSETSLYTCETATPITDVNHSCTRDYQPQFDTDYVYECRAGTEWRAETGTCEPERVVVVDEDYVYACQTGTVWSQTPSSCTRKRVVVVDEDYTYACRSGTEWSQAVNSCIRKRVVVVDEDYEYGCVQTWNGAAHQGNAACTANGAAGCQASTARQCTQASNLAQSYVCQEGYGGTVANYSCTRSQNVQVSVLTIGYMSLSPPIGSAGVPLSSDQIAAVFPGCSIGNPSNVATYGYYYDVRFECPSAPAFLTPVSGGWIAGAYNGSAIIGGARWDVFYLANGGTSGTDQGGGTTDTCGAYSACTKTADICVEGAATRTVSGLAVYRDCWRWAVDYQCGSRTDYAGCSPPTGMSLSTQTCLSTSGGVCTGSQKTYFDPSGGCLTHSQTQRCEDPVAGAGTPSQVLRDVVSDSWDNGCTWLASNSACTKTSETATVGSQTRTINGLAVTKDPWEVQETYSCWTGTNVNSCTALTNAGCSEVANSCVSRGRTNVCTAWDRTYRCEAPVSGSGTVTDTPRDVVSDTWDNGCTSLAANSACAKQSETTTVGSQTRTINGLAVTKDPWEVREDYICWSPTTANNCTSFVGCAETASTCASTDRAGSCSAFNKTYRCENPANGGGTVTETPRDVVGEYWTDPCATKRNDPACSRTSDEVLIGAQTRIINGLSVTRDPWQRRETWVCNRSDVVDSCGPVAGCTLIAKSCGSYSPDGRCTLDTNRYRCENEVTDLTPVDLPKDWTGGTLKDNACPSSGNGACTKTGTLCSQAGQTRLIDGVAVTPSCWQETDSFTCEETGGTASSCSPPSGCTYIGQTCLDDVPDDQCKAWDNRYSCRADISETTNSCKAKVCVGDICIGSDDEADSDMADAMSKLLVAKLASNDVSQSLTIFKGTPMRCRKALFGFNNCCKDSGWGQDLGLAQCSEEEKTLITRQEAKSVHYVGTYCSKKSFFGICREKAMRYCAFDGALARIVQQAGRPQLGKGWGTPANADCSGFTVEEFENLDLTNVDFSEFTTELMAKFSEPDGIVDRMKSTFESMMGSGSPGFGEVTEAKDEEP
jgi:conjugal transfer mating pair stabilization protein TraN